MTALLSSPVLSSPVLASHVLPQVLASDDWPGHGAWFPLFPLLFFGLWVLVFATVGRRWRRGHGPSGESVLAERYARGEIDEVEYRQRQSVLRGKS